MTAHSKSGPRVLILGSCVSRDILNFAGDGSIALVDYYARSSIASLGSSPAQLSTENLDRIASTFQRRMVERDLSKDFLQSAAKHRNLDFILIDLIDERFDLYEMTKDSTVTISSEFLLTNSVTSKDRTSDKWIQSGSDQHRSLWKAGIEKLFATLAQHGLADRVVVNKVFWTDRMEDGSPLPKDKAGNHAAANELLAWMYCELEKYVPSTRWLNFADCDLKCNPKHRWGPAPFHYADTYYANAATQLRKLYAERKNDGCIAIANNVLLAWSGLPSHARSRAAFLVFKDKVLTSTQSYSSATELQFDTRNAAGDYEVVVLTLTADQGDEGQFPPNRRETVHRFRLGEKASD